MQSISCRSISRINVYGNSKCKSDSFKWQRFSLVLFTNTIVPQWSDEVLASIVWMGGWMGINHKSVRRIFNEFNTKTSKFFSIVAWYIRDELEIEWNRDGGRERKIETNPTNSRNFCIAPFLFYLLTRVTCTNCSDQCQWTGINLLEYVFAFMLFLCVFFSLSFCQLYHPQRIITSFDLPVFFAFKIVHTSLFQHLRKNGKHCSDINLFFIFFFIFFPLYLNEVCLINLFLTHIHVYIFRCCIHILNMIQYSLFFSLFKSILSSWTRGWHKHNMLESVSRIGDVSSPRSSWEWGIENYKVIVFIYLFIAVQHCSFFLSALSLCCRCQCDYSNPFSCDEFSKIFFFLFFHRFPFEYLFLQDDFKIKQL